MSEPAPELKPRLPVSVLTGFLGSGKTTLLRELLRNQDLRETLVIVNEFGEIGIDHHLLVEQPDDTVVELSSGCLCCTIRGDLIQTLGNAIWRFSRGGRPWFKRVVIETTGLADPAPILQTLLAQPFIATLYRLAAVIATVDAHHGLDTLDRQPEALKQVAVADRLVLTKLDLVDDRGLAALQAKLDRINPTAARLRARHGRIEDGRLLDDGDYDPEARGGDVLGWLGAEAASADHARTLQSDAADRHAHEPHAAGPEPAGRDRHRHRHDVNRHDERIRAVCLRHAGPIPEAALGRWIDMLLALRGPDLLRIKGLLNIEGRQGPLVIHGVQHIFNPPTELAEWPDADRDSRVVFIVRDIDPRLLEDTLAVALEGHARDLAGSATAAVAGGAS